ncbi:MAG TPA: hypothetical protein VMV82_04170 [Candidatus Dormibacteraeota bacterium]|nr:hypothetical protein [Candidatus Dormibacteraeota bacterium]
MPKRLLFALGVLVLVLVACKSAATITPKPTPSPTPTANPTANTATVNAQYNGSAYLGTIYANAAASGCPGSTVVSGSTVSATPTLTTVNGQSVGQATLSPLTPNTYYTFFYVVGGGPTVSSCTLNWTYGPVTLKYP